MRRHTIYFESMTGINPPRYNPYTTILLLVLLLLAAPCAQSAIVHGVVKDSVVGEPIPYATIYVPGTGQGAICSVDGKFTLDIDKSQRIRVTAINYRQRMVSVKPGSTVTISLTPMAATLDEVVVHRTKEKYKKKGNPAVAFINKVRKHMKDDDPFKHDFFTYDKFEQMTYGFNDLKNTDRNQILKSFPQLLDYLDTLDVSGKVILPISLNEKVSTDYYRRDPSTHKEVIRAQHHVGLDDNYDVSSIKRFMDDAFREVDIFRNDINLMQSRFVSPLSVIGPDFYKYYLADTLMVDGQQCIELDFLPHNTNDFGFVGRMYFLLGDTSMFIKKLQFKVSKSINLNYVDQIYISQNYDRAPDGSRLKTLDDMVIEFRLVKGTQTLYARRLATYNSFTFAKPQDLAVFDLKGEVTLAPGANHYDKDAQYWSSVRPDKIKNDETTMQAMIKRLRSSKLFYWGEKVVMTLAQGYVSTGNPSKLDIGPLNTFTNYNPLEGFRLRVGGMTTANLSKHWFSRWYAAYGFKDEKLKYRAELEYSFNADKKYHSYEFPVNSLKLIHQYDVDKLGQHYLYTSQDNVFLLLKRHTDDRINYLRQTHLQYQLELINGFSVKASADHYIHEASRYLPFVDGYGNAHGQYRQAGFSVTLRYAPGEKFFQTRSYRFAINMDNPVITLTHEFMPKGFLGSDFSVNKTELGVSKRFWFSAFGYTDLMIKAGKIWSKVPYPDLFIPNANLSYTIQPESYTLMNAMEFPHDEYVSWDATYWLNGAIMNRIPIIKKLKLREVVSFRGLYGKLTKKNDPLLHPELYQLPERVQSQRLGSKPYMELGVGIDNILTFLRLDYVWRLTYRDNPDIDKSGVRVQVHIAF